MAPDVGRTDVGRTDLGRKEDKSPQLNSASVALAQGTHRHSVEVAD